MWMQRRLLAAAGPPNKLEPEVRAALVDACGFIDTEDFGQAMLCLAPFPKLQQHFNALQETFFDHENACLGIVAEQEGSRSDRAWSGIRYWRFSRRALTEVTPLQEWLQASQHA